MGTKGRNFVESVARIIPGYKGYSERESRRDSDRLVRQLLAKRLDEARKDVDAAIADCTRRSDFAHLEDLEAVRRRASTEADRLRSAPSGYSGFFDTVQIELEDLERLHEFDARLHEHVEAFAAAAQAMASGPDGERVKTASDALRAVEDHLRRRDAVMKGVE